MKYSYKRTLLLPVNFAVLVFGQHREIGVDHHMDDVHYVDPSMNGSCVACIGARRIYCMDGSGKINGDVNDYKLGSCQPNWSYCTQAGLKQFASFMNFRQCQYTNVQIPAQTKPFTTDMIDLSITDEMAQKVKDGGSFSLLDFLFLPDQYQIVRVTVS